MTSLLCLLHYIIDQFSNTCDKQKLLDSVQPFSFHATKCPVRVTGLLPAVLTFREGIFELWCINFCQGKSFQECCQSLKHYFGDQSPSKGTIFGWFRHFVSGERKLEDDDRCGRMATTVTPENVSRVEVLIKKDPKLTYAEIRDIMKISLGSLTLIFHDCHA